MIDAARPVAPGPSKNECAMASDTPNILFFMVDQMAASVLSMHGGMVAKTPNIDQLAKRGVVFENAYTNFPVCAPSRFSLMSGRLASEIEAYDNAAEFRASIPTIAHYLRCRGYQTALCGKMHFIGPDQLHGFEERLTEEIYSADFMTLPRWDIDDDDYATDANQALLESGPVPRTVQLDFDEEVVFNGERKIYDLARSEDDRPFFLVVSFTHPHEPFLCMQEYWDLYEGIDIDMPRVGRLPLDQLDAHSRRLYSHYKLLDPAFNDTHIRNTRRAYYGSVSYIDGRIGRLLSALEKAGFSDSTIIFLTSDHGEMLGERGMWFKKTFYENSSRVPLVVAGSGLGHRRVRENVSLVDLLPTFVDIASNGAPFDPVEPLAGRSMTPLLNGDAAGWPDTVFSEMTCEGVGEPVMMVKHGPWKYICSLTVPPLLYNLDDDPDEMTNLAGHPDTAGVQACLREMADDTWGDLGELRAKIVASQKTRLLLREALEKGMPYSWDAGPHIAGGSRYLRRGKSYNAWNYGGVEKLRRQARTEAPQKPEVPPK